VLNVSAEPSVVKVLLRVRDGGSSAVAIDGWYCAGMGYMVRIEAGTGINSKTRRKESMEWMT